MNPTRLRLVNVGRWSDVDVDLPAGTVALVGENGQGKSTLLNAIDVALFAERGELNDLLTAGEDRLEIELTFEHAGELYRVRRQMKAGRTPSVDFERQFDGDPDGQPVLEWEPLTRENAAATTTLIGETLGFDRDTFRASSFLKQGDTAAFTEAEPTRRKAILAKALRLELWDDSNGRKPATEASLLGLARADLRNTENRLPAIEAKLELCEQTIEQRAAVERTLDAYRTQLQTATDRLVVAEAALERAQQAKAANQAAAERLRTCQAELDAATADVRRAQAELADAAAAEARARSLAVERDRLAVLAETIPAREQQLERHRARAVKTAERDQHRREAGQREEQRSRLVDEALQLHERARALRQTAQATVLAVEGAAHCDRCGQTLGVDAANRAAESYAAEAAHLDARGNELDAECETLAAAIASLREQAAAVEVPEADGDPVALQRQLTEARAAGETRATLTEQLRQVEELAARKPAIEQLMEATHAAATDKQVAVNEARAAMADEAALERDLAAVRARADACRTEEQRAREAIVRTEQQLEQIDAAGAERDALTGERATVQELIRQLRQAVDAYGRNGTPALIVEAIAVPHLEREANALLALMPTADGTTLQVELRTQRELKGSSELRDALDIVVFDGEHERRYETYSGGEQGRLNLCLRVALADLLRNRRGAESRLLAIDEIPYMDGLGQDEIVEILARHVADKFDRIYVIGHSETFQQSFDNVIRIVKRGGRSVVDEQPVVRFVDGEELYRG